jgi:hypothetical protein
MYEQTGDVEQVLMLAFLIIVSQKEIQKKRSSNLNFYFKGIFV